MAKKVTQVPFAPIHEKLAHPESDHNFADIAGAPEHEIKTGTLSGYALDGRGNPKPSHNPKKMIGGLKSPAMHGKPMPSVKNNGGGGAGSSGFSGGDGLA